MNKQSTKKIKIIAAIALILVIGLSLYVSSYIIKFINDPNGFRNWIDSFGIFSPLAYICINILQIIVPIIPGEPMEIVAGYAFGAFKGSLLCLFASSLGSIIVISLVKKYGRKLVEVFFDKEKIESLKFLQDSNKNILLFSIIFIIPGTPKDLLCYFAGLTSIDTKTLFLITTLGRIPSIITSTIVGGSVGKRNFTLAIVVFILTALISLGGVLLYNYLSKKKHSKEKKPS